MPPPSFEPGETVVCREPDGTWLRAGARYVVLETHQDGRLGPDLVALNRVPGMLWGAWRFVSADTYQK